MMMLIIVKRQVLRVFQSSRLKIFHILLKRSHRNKKDQDRIRNRELLMTPTEPALGLAKVVGRKIRNPKEMRIHWTQLLLTLIYWQSLH
jgi:hypothetical protein